MARDAGRGRKVVNEFESVDSLGLLLGLGYSCFAFSEPAEFRNMRSVQDFLADNGLDASCVPVLPDGFVLLDLDDDLLSREVSADNDDAGMYSNIDAIDVLPEGADVHEEGSSLVALDIGDFVVGEDDSKRIVLPEILKAQETVTVSGKQVDAPNFDGEYVLPDDDGEKSFADYSAVTVTSADAGGDDLFADRAVWVADAEKLFVSVGFIISFLEES